MEQRTAFRLLLLLHLQPLLLLCLNYVDITPCLGEAISKADVCSTNSSSSLTPCQAMVTYFPTNNIQLSEMAFYFSILNYTSLLGPNQFNLSIPDLPDVVLPAAYPFKIPIQSCACSPHLPDSASRVATSINYTVVSGDTLSNIANTYSQLVSYQAIGNASGILDYNKIFPNQSLSIPIPCACLVDDNDTAPIGSNPAKILSYQVQAGDNLSTIATAYNSSVDDLRSLNGNASDSDLLAYNVLFVPLPVCKANFSSTAEDNDLQVLEGAYELTANDCVKCNCQNGMLRCVPANFSSSTCGNQTCFNSTLTLGDFNTSSDANGCLVTSCIYMGYNSSGILSRLESRVEEQCPSPTTPETVYNPPSGLTLPTSPPPPTTSSEPTPSPPTTPANPNSPPSLAPPIVLSIFSLYNFLVLGLSFWVPHLL